MRVPGTCSRYSKNAIPQLATAATYQGRPARFLRCAYQAKVMNTFEATSNSVAERTGLIFQLSACDLEGPERAQRARVSLVHDAAPAARPGALDIVRPIVDEQRRRGLERKTPLGFGVDAGVRLHDAGEVGRQRPLADGMQAVLARKVRPVQVADVGEQEHPVALAETMGEIDHGGLQLEHAHPPLMHLLE